jgi:hypothetical protein
MLGTFRKHFARQDLFHLVVFTAFLIHIWAMINMFHDIPAMLLYMNSNEIVGSLAYNMLFALFETIIVFLILVTLGLLLPSHWARSNFLAVSCCILVELTIMVTLFDILGYRPYSRVLLGGICVITLILTALVVPKYPKMSTIARSISTRLSPLIAAYFLIDLAGVIIVVARNV